MKTDVQVFCTNLRNLRKSRGLTQKELRRLLHISTDYVRRLEMGEIPPRLTFCVLIDIYRVFGILPDTMVNSLLDFDDPLKT